MSNSIKENDFDFVCPGEQVLYWCTALSTGLTWNVTAGGESETVLFDSRVDSPGDGQQSEIAAVNTFIYTQLLTSQNVSCISSQLSFIVSQNNLNGSVSCQSSNGFITLVYKLAGNILQTQFC